MMTTTVCTPTPPLWGTGTKIGPDCPGEMTCAVDAATPVSAAPGKRVASIVGVATWNTSPARVHVGRGVRVGVMGLTTEDTFKMVHPDNVKNIDGAKNDPGARIVAEQPPP